MLEIIVVTLAIISNPAITTSAGIDLSSAASVVTWTDSVFVEPPDWWEARYWTSICKGGYLPLWLRRMDLIYFHRLVKGQGELFMKNSYVSWNKWDLHINGTTLWAEERKINLHRGFLPNFYIARRCINLCNFIHDVCNFLLLISF